MAFKFVVLAAFLAVANAGLIPAAGPVTYAAPAPIIAPLAKTIITKEVDAEHDPHPQYSFAYDVEDSLTGDSKSQHETRDGDVVHGSYSLLEADGTRRTVDYTADAVNGFNAVVRKEPAGVAVKAIAPAPVAYAAPAPVAYAAHAPAILTKTYAPAPVLKTYAPVAKVATVAHAPVAYASPLAYHHPAPIYHQAPLGYSAPLAYHGAPLYHAPLAKYAAPAAYIH